MVKKSLETTKLRAQIVALHDKEYTLDQIADYLKKKGIVSATTGKPMSKMGVRYHLLAAAGRSQAPRNKGPDKEKVLARKTVSKAQASVADAGAERDVKLAAELLAREDVPAAERKRLVARILSE